MTTSHGPGPSCGPSSSRPRTAAEPRAAVEPESAPEPCPAAEPASERRARITWSMLAEPSDSAAHAVCTMLGVAGALDALDDGDAGQVEAVLREWPVRDAADPPSRGQDPAVSAHAALRRWRERRSRLDVDDALDRAQQQGMRVIVPGERDWPEALDDLGPRAPFCLWAHGPGDPAALADSRAVAIVGSRASTPYGEDCAGSFAAQLAAEGSMVLSGGAYGIDAAAHRGALAAGGPTLAVLAGGLDSLYPRGNDSLLRSVRERHLLLSEAPPGTAPTRWRFLERNRLIAALAQVTVVVEASWRSGALSTARRAMALRRPVASVPGPISSAASAGCHRLIREEGAILVTEPGEVTELLPHSAPAGDPHHAVQDELDIIEPSDRRVLDAVPPRSATTLDRIAQETGFSALEVRAAAGRIGMLGLLSIEGDNVRRRRA